LLLLAQGLVGAGCLAHSRRKFFDQCANHQSQIATAVRPFFSHLYQIEKRTAELTAEERRQLRQSESRPMADALLAWMVARHKPAPNGSAIAEAITYRVNRWQALMRLLDDGRYLLFGLNGRWSCSPERRRRLKDGRSTASSNSNDAAMQPTAPVDNPADW
jgi:hypothetical protein